MDWREYNMELVRRGEAVFDLDFLKNYRDELKRMNMGKVGRRFRYPESLIMFLATVHKRVQREDEGDCINKRHYR